MGRDLKTQKKEKKGGQEEVGDKTWRKESRQMNRGNEEGKKEQDDEDEEWGKKNKNENSGERKLKKKNVRDDE